MRVRKTTPAESATSEAAQAVHKQAGGDSFPITVIQPPAAPVAEGDKLTQMIAERAAHIAKAEAARADVVAAQAAQAEAAERETLNLNAAAFIGKEIAVLLGVAAPKATAPAKRAPKGQPKAKAALKAKGVGVGKADIIAAAKEHGGKWTSGDIVAVAIQATGKRKPANASAIIATMVQAGTVKDTGETRGTSKLYTLK